MKGLSKYDYEEEVVVSGQEKRRFTGKYWMETVKGYKVMLIEEEEIIE